MKCRVTKLAFHNGERLKPGRVVDITTRKIPGWCEKISVAAAEEVEAPAVAPKAKRVSKAATAAGESEAPKNEIEGAGQDLV